MRVLEFSLLFPWLGLIFSVVCKCGNSSYRLPPTIKPIRYNLTIEPILNVANISASWFYGSVVIEIEALDTTSTITLNSKNLTIDPDSIRVVDFKKNTIDVYSTSIDIEKQFYIINLKEELQSGNHYQLLIGSYSGNLKGRDGLYLAKYTDTQVQQRYLTLTNFGAWTARKAFPCFDEPALKAKFTITLIRPEGLKSVSNEELITSKDLGDGRYQDTFRETVPMSTYLVAFAISNYSYTDRIDRIRIFARPEMIDDGRADFMLSESAKILKALEEFTGINYTLRKMDLFAAPKDYFVDGAMENWGLVIYNEKHLLYSKSLSTTEDLQRLTTYATHELAHQWFGNLVTHNWWNYMWLSEGFASFLQYHVSDTVEPSWRLKEQYVLDYLFAAFSYDMEPTVAMNSEPALYESLQSPYVLYHKASAVIRMAEHFLSYSVFKNGIRMYLQENEFKATSPPDVYDAFQKALDEAGAQDLLGSLTVSDILTTWDSNPGFPLVTATRDYETGAITLTQEIYNNNNETEYGDAWYIPITYVTSNDNKNFSKTTADFWLTRTTDVLNRNLTTDGWILLNKQVTGYYRVNYDITNWKRLIELLRIDNFEAIHPLNRAQLIEDSFSLAQLGRLPCELLLNLTSYIRRETDFIPLSTFITNLNVLQSFMDASEASDIFQEYVRDLLSLAASHLGYDEKPNDTHIDKLSRAKILAVLCRYGDPQCNKAGIKKLKLWKGSGSKSISPDLEISLLCGAMQIATPDTWEFLYQEYISSVEKHQRMKYIAALGCLTNKNILNSYLDVICDVDDTIPLSEKRLALGSIASAGKKSMDILIEYFANRSSNCSVEAVDAYVITEEQAKQVNELRRTGKHIPLILFIGDAFQTDNKCAVSQITEWLLQYSKVNLDNNNMV